MKKYRLKKDTPTIKAGTIFQEVTSDYDKSRELVWIMPTSGTTSPQWTIDDINNFDEWFEEVKRFEEWKPKMGDSFKTLSSCGDIYCSIWNGGSDHEYCLSIGNCYPLDTPNKVIIKEQELIPRAMHRLKMAAKKAWFEYDGSEGPDWVDHNPVDWRYCIEFDHETYSFKINGYDSLQILGVVYFPTEDSCQAYIDSNKDDLKLLFGVE